MRNDWSKKESSEATYKSIKWKTMVHEKKVIGKKDLKDLQYWRLSMIDLLSYLRPNSVAGKVLDLGAGQGFASAYLSSFASVRSVRALDYSVEACNLILQTAENFKGAKTSKLIVTQGSFTDIKDTDYNLMVAFGAVHNAPDFELVFQQAYTALVNGGRLLVSDTCLVGMASLADEEYATERQIPNSYNFYGQTLRYRDTNDYFRSVVDFIFFAKKAGFRVFPILWNCEANRKLQDLDADFSESILPNFLPLRARGRFDPLLLICEKDVNHRLDIFPKNFVTPRFSEKILIHLKKILHLY